MFWQDVSSVLDGLATLYVEFDDSVAEPWPAKRFRVENNHATRSVQLQVFRHSNQNIVFDEIYGPMTNTGDLIVPGSVAAQKNYGYRFNSA